jgi:hypothetical protein
MFQHRTKPLNFMLTSPKCCTIRVLKLYQSNITVC